ncbi:MULTISPECIES: hypothetical protein [Streptomyces]|uniref:hypothetical protein n=1 Tax=Streptomyces TaxID=1883 RepID=UPI00288BA6FD|nr:hypothetical protein [Streptomyces sp. DSM 41529]
MGDPAGGARLSVSALVHAELERHDWAALSCGCGESAEHVPLMFEAILTAGTPRDMIGYTLDNHLEIGTNLFEAAVPAVGVILAALAGDPSPPARRHLLDTLCHLVSGDSHATEQAAGRTELGDECRRKAREGYWLIARTGLTGSADDAGTAADICEFIDLDDERSGYYQALLRERMSAKTKRRPRG